MTYVISDIHGRFDEFLKMLKKIDFKDTDTLYILGDAVDRGPGSIKCLQYIMKQPNMHMLIGNHEYMMLDVLSSPEIKFYRRCWHGNGGDITEYQYNELSNSEKKDIFEFIKNLPSNFDITVNGQRYILAHAYPQYKYYGQPVPMINGYENETEFIVWERGIPPEIDDTIIIFGHTPVFHYSDKNPCEIVSFDDTRINIDCGAAYPVHGGRLGCMRLDDNKEFYVPINGFGTSSGEE